MSEVSVRELDGLMRELAQHEKLKAETQAMLTNINKAIMALEQKCTLFLKENARSEYKSDWGTLKIKERWTVGLPQTDKDKLEFFKWLKSRGIFEKYATVNSMSLNSLFKTEWEQAKKEGNINFALPGVPQPKLFEHTEFRPNKEKLKELENESTNPRITDAPARGLDPNDEIPF